AGRVPGGRARRPAARRQRLLPYAVARLPVRVAGRAGCLTLRDASSHLLADVLSDVGINAFSVVKGRTDYPKTPVMRLFRILKPCHSWVGARAIAASYAPQPGAERRCPLPVGGCWTPRGRRCWSPGS